MPINDYFIFDGKKSTDYGLYMGSDPQAVHPARRGETFPIPGRNGVIVREDGSYDTYTQSYDVFFDSNTHAADIYGLARKVASLLLGSRGFCRLEDSYEPEYFRLARCAAQMSVENRLTRFGRAQIPFECQPQRYLKTGENEIRIMTPYSGEGGSAPGEIKTAIPYGAVSMYSIAANSESNFFAYFLDESGQTVGDILDTDTGAPSNVPDGAITIRCVWNNVASDFSAIVGMVNSDGEQIPLCGVNGTSPVVFNPTDYESRPLLKFVDISEEPTPVPRYFTKEYQKGIGNGGAIVPASRENYITVAVSLDTFAYAIVSGLGYSFLDSNDNCVAYYSVGVSGQSVLNEKKIIIPANATKIMLAGSDTVEASLSLLAERTNPGTSAVTINGTTISLDFSEHDTIYLDCDLHDAYYIDGSSANSKVSFSNNFDPYPTFPALVSGENTVIARDSANINFSIVPRWWTL